MAHILRDDISIIKHARKSPLFNDGKPWIKKDNKSLFHATIGSYDRQCRINPMAERAPRFGGPVFHSVLIFFGALVDKGPKKTGNSTKVKQHYSEERGPIDQTK